MPTGRPLSLKCPSCKAGKYGFGKSQGVTITDRVKVTKRGASRLYRRLIICKACEHEWWSTLAYLSWEQKYALPLGESVLPKPVSRRV